MNLQEEIGAGSAIYKAMLNLIVINGAKDFSHGGFPEHEELDDHHIVPKSWGKKNGLTKEINSICNRTLIAADTNRFKIGMSMPSEYLTDLLDCYSSDNEYGKNLAREILDSHFISEKAQGVLMREDFSADDFREFIQEREKTLKTGIKELLMNEAPSVKNTHLDVLNKDIEQVEIELRQLICTTLNNDLEKLPTHLLGNAQKRIEGMLKKDGAKKLEDYQDMLSILSFFDLRDLEQVIVSKACGSDFEPVIGNKVTFQKKMNQLAELRNPLRHSRNIDEVAHKEGDAAVIWFKEVLGI